MGIIKAAMNAVGGTLGDSWLEVIEPGDMDATTVMCPGVSKARNDGRNTNHKGTANTVSNGSIIQVYDNQMMLLVDGGAIVDYTAEPGYFEVKNSSLPSLFNGQFGDTLKDTFNRFKFSGVTPTSQRVVYINLKPMEGIKFGTPNPVSFYDAAYDIDVSVRAHGKFSVDIVDPLKFYKTVIATSSVINNEVVKMDTLMSQRYDLEIISALEPALAGLSMKGVKGSQVSTHLPELREELKIALHDVWVEERGIELRQIGISITPDEETKELLKERNKVAIYNNAGMRETLMQKNISEGIRDAGSNANGAMAGFMGIGMGMNASGGFMQAASSTNMQQMQMEQQMQQQRMMQQQQPMQQQPMQQQMQQPAQTPNQQPAASSNGWTCSCGKTGNTGKFCAECGQPKPAPVSSDEWTCVCGVVNKGKFCAECGAKRPDPKPKKIKCDKCGYEPDMSQPIPKFCPECGDPINGADYV